MNRTTPVFLLLAFLFLSAGLHAQVGRTARITPQRSYMLGIMPIWYPDETATGLVPVYPNDVPEVGLGAGLSARYGVNYSLDMGIQVAYIYGGKPMLGADLMFLVREARYSYISLGGGVHYWDNPGIDLRALFTYNPRYQISITGGLDLDVNYDPVMDNKIRTRVWLPVNVGFEVSKTSTLFAEFNLQVSQLSWSIVALGANIVFR